MPHAVMLGFGKCRHSAGSVESVTIPLGRQQQQMQDRDVRMVAVWHDESPMVKDRQESLS